MPRINYGQIERGRPQQRKKDNDLVMVIWNAKGAILNTLADLDRYKIKRAAVPENRWMDSGIHSMSQYSLYFSGTSNNPNEFGTGFLVTKHIDHLVLNFVPINEYMCTLPIRT